MSRGAIQTLEDLEQLSDQLYSPTLYLNLEALSLRELSLDHICSHIGKATGLVTALRHLPFAHESQRVLAPVDVLFQHNVKQEHLFQNKNTSIAGLQDAVFAIATRANDHIITARTMMKEVKPQLLKQAINVFLYGVPIRFYLQQLEKCDFNIYKAPPAIYAHPSLIWQIWRAHSSMKI